MLDSAPHWVWGSEALLTDGQAVGELSSVGWSVKAQACVGLGRLRGASAQQVHCTTALHVDLWGEAIGAKARDASYKPLAPDTPCSRGVDLTARGQRRNSPYRANGAGPTLSLTP